MRPWEVKAGGVKTWPEPENPRPLRVATQKLRP
jgi:hypothetical protein